MPYRQRRRLRSPITMILNQVNMPQLLNLQVVLRDRLHPVGLGAWYGRRWHGNGPTVVVGRWGVAAVAGYIGLCLVSQMVAQHLLARALGPQRAAVERLT